MTDPDWINETRDPRALMAHPRNPRTHSADQVARLARLIREFGFTAPALIHADDELIAGHARTQAAILAELTEIPVRVRNPKRPLTEAQVLALIVADNKAAEDAGWDDAALASIMGTLQEANYDVALTGFTLPEVRSILDQDGSSAEDERANAEAEDAEHVTHTRPRTSEGDVWILGPHVMVCGDSFEPDTRRTLLEVLERKPSVIITDPPYAIYGSSSGIASDIADDKMVRPFFEALGRACAEIVPDFAHVYTFTDWRSWSALWEGMKRSGLTPKNCLVWDKGSFGLGANWPNAHEFVGFFTKIPPHGAMTSNRKGGQRQVLDHANILRFPRVAGAERLHNAAKPVALLALLVEKASDPGEVVVDLFGGSGSTLIAADQVGRRCGIVEMEPKTCDVILARWERRTGLTAQRREGKAW